MKNHLPSLLRSRYIHSTASSFRLRASFHTNLPTQQQLKYPFPSRANPTAHEIFHLSPDASGADIKKRYFELVRIYHPDTAQSQGITLEQAEARFHAITQAYNALQQLDPNYRARAPDGTSLDKEAEEIKERLAKWARMGQSSQDRARRQRAMDAEASAGKWWKSDLAIIYLLGAVMVVVTVTQVQGRTIPAQKEKLQKYIDMHRNPEPPTQSKEKS
ncbi:hypothetical protein CPB86DRAFT_704610 [Serendipita vermifera]|nr:hypothetical protein CPB86DRAFT_704610 [Serendipita vermifera]